MDDQNKNTYTMDLDDLQIDGTIDVGSPPPQQLADTRAREADPVAMDGDQFFPAGVRTKAANDTYSEVSYADGDATQATSEGALAVDLGLTLPTGMPHHMAEAQDHTYTEASFGYADGEAVELESGTGRIVATLAAAIGLALFTFVGFLIYEALSLGVDPANHIMVSFGLSEPEVAQIQSVVPVNRSATAKPPGNAATSKTARTAGVVPENPYWELPNPVPQRAHPDARYWSTEERVIWKSGIAHKYNYQRYLTLDQVRTYQLKGSEEILWQGLREPKLWSRMSAVMGLAEVGVPVDVDLVEQAIGQARPSLVRNYFKRFKRARTDGELYVLRQAIKVVDAPARRIILEVIARANDHLTPVYLVAATFDPGEDISRFARQQLLKAKVTQATFDSLHNYLKGVGPLPSEIAQASTKSPSKRRVAASKAPTVNTVESIRYFQNGGSQPLVDEDKRKSNPRSGLIEIGRDDLK